VTPLVSCVCPTTGARLPFLKQAIACFLAQDYSNKELLIVTDSTNSVGIHRHLAEAPAIVTCIHRPIQLGAKRNAINEQARGEIICHFDDDDWSAPGRISDQIEHLRAGGKPVTGYARMKFTDGSSWWRYKDPLYPLGTSLCYLKSWWETHRFYDTQVGSDTVLIHAAQLAGEVHAVECGDMMFARVHGGNTNKTPQWETSAWEPLTEKDAVCV
jgi:O-antigen biosynthesis protein